MISPSRIRNNKDNRDSSRTSVSPIPVPPLHNRTNDALSKNITSLLENLLKNYDSNHHPGYETGQVIYIYTFQCALQLLRLISMGNRLADRSEKQHFSSIHGSFLRTSNGKLLEDYQK